MRERIYSPQLGQFLQTAPSRIAGDVNLYACVNNDPLNGIDWSGLDYSAEESSLTYDSGKFEAGSTPFSILRTILECRREPSGIPGARRAGLRAQRLRAGASERLCAEARSLVTDEFAEGPTPTQTRPPPARHEQERALLERCICTLRRAGSIAANERGAFDAGGRAAADP
jgi:hypothetical protein